MSELARAFECQILESRKAVTEKWLAFLDTDKAEKIENPMSRYIVAQLLENTVGNVSRETYEAVSTNVSSGTVVANTGGTYSPQQLGMIRKIFPKLIAPEIASIQPLTQPVAQVFMLDMKRDDGSDIHDPSSYQASRTYADHTGGEGTLIQKGAKITLGSALVQVGNPKKLRTEASLELTQDLRAAMGLDAQSLLQEAAIDEIKNEIDAHLVNIAWLAAGAANTVTFGPAPSSGGWTSETYAKRLQRTILEADNIIWKKRGVGATTIVCGADFALELLDLSAFRMDGSFNGGDVAGFGLERLGTLNMQGGFRVLRSRLLPAKEAVVLRRGDSILDAGLFYLPYIPLFTSDPEFDTQTQKFHRSYMSRFATHVASNDYFVKLKIDGTAAAGITIS